MWYVLANLEYHHQKSFLLGVYMMASLYILLTLAASQLSTLDDLSEAWSQACQALYERHKRYPPSGFRKKKTTTTTTLRALNRAITVFLFFLMHLSISNEFRCWLISLTFAYCCSSYGQWEEVINSAKRFFKCYLFTLLIDLFLPNKRVTRLNSKNTHCLQHRWRALVWSTLCLFIHALLNVQTYAGTINNFYHVLHNSQEKK